MTLALLNVSSERTPASSPVVRCFTHTPAFPGKRESSASSKRCSPDAVRGGCDCPFAGGVASIDTKVNTTVSRANRMAITPLGEIRTAIGVLHPVPHYDRPVAHRRELRALEIELARKTREEGTPLADRDRCHDERQFVDEIGCEEALGETGAVLNDDVVALLTLQRRDLLGRIAARESSVLPGDVAERP